MIFYFDDKAREIKIISVVQGYALAEKIGRDKYNKMSKQQRVDAITGQKDTTILTYNSPNHVTKDRVFEIVDSCFHAFASDYRVEAKEMVKELLNT